MRPGTGRRSNHHRLLRSAVCLILLAGAAALFIRVHDREGSVAGANEERLDSALPAELPATHPEPAREEPATEAGPTQGESARPLTSAAPPRDLEATKAPFTLPPLRREIGVSEPRARLDSFYPVSPPPKAPPRCRNHVYVYTGPDGERVVSTEPRPDLAWQPPSFHMESVQVRESLSGNDDESLLLFGTYCTNARTGARTTCSVAICSLRVVTDRGAVHMALPVRGSAFQEALPRQRVLAAVLPSHVRAFYVRVGAPGSADGTWAVDLDEGSAKRTTTSAWERRRLETLLDPREYIDLGKLRGPRGYGFQSQESCARIVASRMPREPEPLHGKEEDPDPLLAAVASLAAEHRIELVVQDRVRAPSISRGESYAPPERAQLEQFLPNLALALEQYPPGFLSRLELGPVILAGDVRGREESLSGLVSWPDSPFESLILDVGVLHDRGRHGVALTVHHEIFHVVQHRPEAAAALSDWASLNPTETTYVGRNWRELSSTPRGMVSTYSARNAREDQAEVFSRLMATPTALQSRVAEDAHLGAKVRKIEEALIAVDSHVEPEFWTALSGSPSHQASLAR